MEFFPRCNMCNLPNNKKNIVNNTRCKMRRPKHHPYPKKNVSRSCSKCLSLRAAGNTWDVLPTLIPSPKRRTSTELPSSHFGLGFQTQFPIPGSLHLQGTDTERDYYHLEVAAKNRDDMGNAKFTRMIRRKFCRHTSLSLVVEFLQVKRQ